MVLPGPVAVDLTRPADSLLPGATLISTSSVNFYAIDRWRRPWRALSLSICLSSVPGALASAAMRSKAPLGSSPVHFGAAFVSYSFEVGPMRLISLASCSRPDRYRLDCDFSGNRHVRYCRNLQPANRAAPRFSANASWSAKHRGPQPHEPEGDYGRGAGYSRS